MDWNAEWSILGLCLALWGAWRLRLRAAAYAAGSKRATVTNPYHCVAVRACAQPCESARRIGTRRFLSSEAPPLPLEACEAGDAACTYMHFEDRRSGPRRGPLAGRAAADAAPFERRQGRGRRATDVAPVPVRT